MHFHDIPPFLSEILAFVQALAQPDSLQWSVDVCKVNTQNINFQNHNLWTWFSSTPVIVIHCYYRVSQVVMLRLCLNIKWPFWNTRKNVWSAHGSEKEKALPILCMLTEQKRFPPHEDVFSPLSTVEGYNPLLAWLALLIERMESTRCSPSQQRVGWLSNSKETILSEPESSLQVIYFSQWQYM